MSSTTLAILGAGELGQQIAHFALSDGHYDKVVFYDDINQSTVILGNTDKAIEDYKKGLFDEILIGIGYNHLAVRQEKYLLLKNQIPFGKIIHTSCFVDKTAVIEEGVVLYPRTVLDKKVHIKANTILNLSVTVSHDTTIGESCFVAPSVAIAGFCKIDNQVFIGINSTIVDNLNLTKNSVIGAGSVLTKNTTESGIYFGNPAKRIK
jgi:sugar O-acyltransferase (sialic acid O-acetyltransferase NeuD family)